MEETPKPVTENWRPPDGHPITVGRAKALLADEDWQEINAAFALNHDPIGEQMFGVAREKKFDALLATILEFTREPAGPGTA